MAKPNKLNVVETTEAPKPTKKAVTRSSYFYSEDILQNEGTDAELVVGLRVFQRGPNGERVKNAQPVFERLASEYPENVRSAGQVKGITAWLMAGAVPSKAATVEAGLQSIRDADAALLSGNLETERDGNAALIKAVAEFKGISVDVVREKIDAMTSKDRGKLKRIPEIKEIMERNAGTVDLDEARGLLDF